MNGTKFLKFCKDSKLINKTLTTTDVDLVFTKVVPKGEKKMTFELFVTALPHLAAKHFPKDPEADEKLMNLILEHGSAKVSEHASVVQTDGVFAKLTDSSQYTGTHKET